MLKLFPHFGSFAFICPYLNVITYIYDDIQLKSNVIATWLILETLASLKWNWCRWPVIDLTVNHWNGNALPSSMNLILPGMNHHVFLLVAVLSVKLWRRCSTYFQTYLFNLLISVQFISHNFTMAYIEVCQAEWWNGAARLDQEATVRHWQRQNTRNHPASTLPIQGTHFRDAWPVMSHQSFAGAKSRGWPWSSRSCKQTKPDSSRRWRTEHPTDNCADLGHGVRVTDLK